jgi:hypothetical protein
LGGAGLGGAPFGGCLGFPSGPSSSLACATTIGAVCACDALELANCIAVRAVVASSTRRRFVMMIEVPGKVLSVLPVKDYSTAKWIGRAINSQPLGRIVAGGNTKALFISLPQWVAGTLVHYAFRRRLQ